jgi:hypothetical protein
LSSSAGSCGIPQGLDCLLQSKCISQVSRQSEVPSSASMHIIRDTEKPHEREHTVLPQQFTFTRVIRSTSGRVVLVGIVVAVAFLVVTHTEHVLAAIPYVLVVLCPLLHVFMHGGHDNHTEPTALSPVDTTHQRHVQHGGHQSGHCNPHSS